MTLADLAAWWPQAASALATGAGGFGLNGYLGHLRAKRKQTDEVALDLVVQLREKMEAVEKRCDERIAAVEAASERERQVCDAKLEAADHKLSVVRHELGNVESAFDGLLLAIRFAPPEKIPEIVEIAQQQRAARSRKKAEPEPAAAGG